jgi:hypothetical protein
MMMRMIVRVVVRVRMIVAVIMIVGMRMSENALVAMIVPVMMWPMLVMLKDRLDAGRDGHVRLRLRIELLAEEKHQGRSEEREQRDQPNLV